jgi:hypothetical protein
MGDTPIAREQLLHVGCRKMSHIYTESRKRVIRNAVDKIEDARIPEFNKAQQGSTSRPHLIETEAVENRAFLHEAGIRLGHRCAPLWRICRFNNLENRAC